MGKNLVIAGLSVLLSVIALVSCSSAPVHPDSGGISGVRVADYKESGWNCKVFLHDNGIGGGYATGSTSSIAVWCK